MSQPSSSTPRLRLAVQKSGRLADSTLRLFERCGLRLRQSREALLSRLSGLPIDVLMVRDDDIPGFVADGIAHMGIVGENVFSEHRLDDETDRAGSIAMRLGISRCRLSIASPAGGSIAGAKDLQGKRIATSYPATTRDFLARNGVTAEIVTMSGSVEVAPRLQIADAVCDIVSTGATLEANGLSEIEAVLQSEALLIQQPGPLPDALKVTANRLMTRISGVQRAAENKYIIMHAPADRLDQVIAMLPGSESPTISSLNNRPGMVAVAAVCAEDVFWETMEELKRAGASDILVLPIEKIMD